ncbi:MAG TPA: dienelactone hydrolase family protein [Stellaceae bacterium]|nr:dienelactone hydrolase family protein [Stellaceae bacterium]
MIIKDGEYADVPTPTGPMRVHVFRPAAAGRYPAILLFSEIYQITGPIRRMAAFLAGQGYVVGAPEVYHEFEPAGTVLAYDPAGTDRGNDLKFTKEVSAFDSDARAGLDFLAAHPASTGRLGVMGICLGGHLAFRAAMNRDVRAAACFYATDIHTHSLGKGSADDSLERAGDIKGELLCVWGRQDPHIPRDGRNLIRARLEEVGACYHWLEVNAQHAFLRDEGPRYDPALAYRCYGLVMELFHRRLGEGDLRG